MSSNMLEFATIIVIIIIIVNFTRSRKLQRVLKYVTFYITHIYAWSWSYEPKYVALLSIAEYKKSCFMVIKITIFL